MGHHRLARRLGVAGDNRLHDGLVLFGQAGKYRRHQIHTLTALLDGGVQQVEKAAHGLQEHHVMRGFGDGQMEADVRLRGDIRVFALGRFKAQANFSLSASVARIAACHAVLASMAWRASRMSKL